MMSDEKQIEELAEILWRACEASVSGCGEKGCNECMAKTTIDAGYRRQSENVIELPCKVGDILYVISRMSDKRILPFINEYEVTSITIKKKSVVIWHEMDGYIKNFKQNDFGKTIFLTKEDAEQAIAKMGGGAE